MNKLDIKALGLAVGIFWGLYCALLGMVAMLFGCGAGLVDGFIGGVVVAWLYNRLER